MHDCCIQADLQLASCFPGLLAMEALNHYANLRYGREQLADEITKGGWLLTTTNVRYHAHARMKACYLGPRPEACLSMSFSLKRQLCAMLLSIHSAASLRVSAESAQSAWVSGMP